MNEIIAITACPNGVAQTYFAAEILRIEAQKRNLNIKIETRGLRGSSYHFSKKDIEDAQLVLIIADVALDLSPFKNKKILEFSVGSIIRNPDKLFKKVLLELSK